MLLKESSSKVLKNSAKHLGQGSTKISARRNHKERHKKEIRSLVTVWEGEDADLSLASSLHFSWAIRVWSSSNELGLKYHTQNEPHTSAISEGENSMEGEATIIQKEEEEE